MSLDVKILWVEEERSWLRGARECLEERLREKLALGLDERDAIDIAGRAGREIDAKWVRDEVARFKGYDMVFIDYRLNADDDTTGAHFAKQLRSAKKYTEIIFYSAFKEEAAEALRREDLQLSGIYLVGRGQNSAPDEFVAECFPIVEDILGKILDLTRMRGIVVAEMSDIESELADRVMAHPKFKEVDGARVVSLAAANLKERAGDVLKIDAKGRKAPELLENEKIRRRIFQRQVVEQVAKDIAGGKAFDEYSKATERLRNPRNDLAHKSRLPGEYDDARFLKIRRDIERCRRLLDEAFPPVTPE